MSVIKKKYVFDAYNYTKNLPFNIPYKCVEVIVKAVDEKEALKIAKLSVDRQHYSLVGIKY